MRVYVYMYICVYMYLHMCKCVWAKYACMGTRRFHHGGFHHSRFHHRWIHHTGGFIISEFTIGGFIIVVYASAVVIRQCCYNKAVLLPYVFRSVINGYVAALLCAQCSL